MSGTARSPLPRLAAVLLALPLIFSAALGIGVLIQPDSIVEGGQISITLSNVTDGSVLNTTLVSSFPAASSTSWFNITNWNSHTTIINSWRYFRRYWRGRHWRRHARTWQAYWHAQFCFGLCSNVWW